MSLKRALTNKTDETIAGLEGQYVNNLVAEKITTTNMNTIVFDNLDITRDGGIYDIVLSTFGTSPVIKGIFLQVNNLTGYNCSTNRINGNVAITGTGTNQCYVWINNDKIPISELKQDVATIYTGTLFSSNGQLGINGISNLVTSGSQLVGTYTGGKASVSENITKLTFSLEDTTSNFAIGTKIQIFKRNVKGTQVSSVVEIITGKEMPTNEFVDGKRVYSKLFELNVGTDVSFSIAHGISEINKYWIDNKMSYYKNTTNSISLPINFYGGATDFCRGYIDKNTLTLAFGSTYSSFNKTAYVNVLYTKN